VQRRISKFVEIQGWLTQEEAITLCYLTSTLKSKSTVVEIGSWKGRSTYCLARGLPAGAELFAIDPFDKSGEAGSVATYSQDPCAEPLRKQFEMNMTRLGVMDRITILQGLSVDFVNHFQNVDFLFIDGDHSLECCRSDFENYSPLIKVGGLVALHDYDTTRPLLGPTWVVENLISPSSSYKFVYQRGSLWIAEKKLSKEFALESGYA